MDESLTYYGETTAPGVAVDCRDRRECDFHYVVRTSGGLWVRAFHNEKDARAYVGCLHVGGCDRHRAPGAESFNVAGAITVDGAVPSPGTPEGWGTDWV